MKPEGIIPTLASFVINLSLLLASGKQAHVRSIEGEILSSNDLAVGWGCKCKQLVGGGDHFGEDNLCNGMAMRFNLG